jgi:dTDP-4-amino-4,6-dideoxygalactose transaminase
VIPFLDLQAQYRTVGEDIEAAVTDVLRSGDYVQGARVAAFERDFAAWCGTQEAVAVSSGTAALHLALLAAGVGPGDEVITVPMTFVATAAAILYTGATPVFVDIDPSTWTMDPVELEAAITSRTKAILPVHLHGRLADMAEIVAVARRHGLVVIEDAAQAHGAERGGRRAGAFGDIGCFSFYPGKNLGACGEGGAVVTDRPELAEQVRLLRDWGQIRRYEHVKLGFNLRMDNVQGAVLRVKLPRLDGWNARRRAVAALYRELLDGTALRLPAPAGEDHVFHVHAVRVDDRDGLRAALEAAGVATGIHYPKPVHLQTGYASLGYGPGAFPEAERMAREALSLPIFPEMTEAQVRTVAAAVRRFTEGARDAA